ncbi:MAG: amidohydrolase, partial [Panacibacter sp.]
MKKILITLTVLAAIGKTNAQETIYPAPAQSGNIALTHATIHIGNGQVLQDAMIVFNNGKIMSVGPTEPIKDNAKIIDCTGKQIYPGLISPNTDLGLSELSAVRSTNDNYELGNINPNIHSLIAYNTDSKVIDNTRSNGVLLANIIPQGGIISGTSSIVQLDAWNWEDASYQKDNGIHFNMPYLERFSTEGDDP